MRHVKSLRIDYANGNNNKGVQRSVVHLLLICENNILPFSACTTDPKIQLVFNFCRYSPHSMACMKSCCKHYRIRFKNYLEFCVLLSLCQKTLILLYLTPKIRSLFKLLISEQTFYWYIEED